jgi:hypothetical protein
MAKLEDREFWLNAEKLLESLLGHVKNSLDPEAVSSVTHYLNHSEYEMAYEGLFIELMKLSEKPKDINFEAYTELGKALKLDVDSIFDSEFWSKYIAYAGSMKSKGSELD